MTMTKKLIVIDACVRQDQSRTIKALSALWGLGEVLVLAASGMDYAGEDGVERKIAEAVQRSSPEYHIRFAERD